MTSTTIRKKKIWATQMVNRDDTAARGRLLPCVHSIREAASWMGVSPSTVRRMIGDLKGWITLTTPGSQQPACCIDHR